MPGLVRPVADERDALLSYLAQQRHVLRVAAYGLTDEQARSTPTRSILSVGGLLKHVTHTESSWVDTILQLPAGGSDAYAESFRMRAEESLGELLDRYAAVARRTEDVVAAVDDLGRPVPVPRGVPWFPPGIEAWSVRWVLLHLVEETARHAGHADILRENIDGATAFPLLAAAEDWPATPWMQPWTPAGASS
jgi:uncharacterized damage-inducible protein DinB